MTKRISSDILSGADRHGMKIDRRDGALDFVSKTTGKVVWSPADSAAARRFVSSCDINPSTIEHIVHGRL